MANLPIRRAKAVAQPGAKASLSLGVKAAGLAKPEPADRPEPMPEISADGQTAGAQPAETQQPGPQEAQANTAGETANLEGSQILS